MPDKPLIGELSEYELRALVPELQSLTAKYKRSEKIQQALYAISELAFSLEDFESFYKEIHDIVAGFMPADNFFVAFREAHNPNDIQFAYFVDEQDDYPSKVVAFEKVKDGITGYILKSGNNLLLTKENFIEKQQQCGFEVLGTPPVDFMGVPLIRNNVTIGAMVVQSYHDAIRYDADDLEILIFISQHIVTARDRVINREITESLIQERTQQLVEANKTLEAEITERMRVEKLQKALFEISELSTKADHDIREFYPNIHEILKQLIYAENFYIALLDESNENLEFPYFIGEDTDYHSTRKLTRGLTEYVIRSEQSLLVDSTRINELVESNEIERKFVIRMIEIGNSWMGAPLYIGNEVKGVLAVQTYGKGNDYTEQELNILRFVSQHISVAIQRLAAANELIKYNQQLSEKVQERTAELNQTNESLKQQIEQRKEIELRLIHDAHHDALTGLPNRAMFNSRLELAIASKKRHANHKYALLFIDLDRFKTINDTLGHHAGDEFLIEAAARINACKRSHDLLARLGGDEFVVLIDNFTSQNDVEMVAHRIVESIGKGFVIEDKEVFSGASIGIAEINQDYEHSDQALRDADAAMYQAKSLGRNRYVVFDMSMRNQLMDEIDDEREFRLAFKAGEFEYLINPIKNLNDNSVLFYECSVFWPNYAKCQNPQDFWVLADKTGLTSQINQTLVEEAFNLLHKWQSIPDLKHTKLGISLSVEHLLNKSSFEDIIDKLEGNEDYCERLVLELSEKSLSKFNKFLPSMLTKLQNFGITLVLDGFGSHSGSLNHLFKFDFDYLILNEGLVNTFDMSDKYYRLVQSIILMAKEMDITVIAEGVDDDMIVQQLIEVGCEFGQGKALENAKKLA